MGALAQRIAAILPRLRAEAESLMFDECIAQRPTGHATEGYKVVPTLEDVYAGICAIAGDRPHETPVIVGDSSSLAKQRHIIKLPAAAGPFLVGDVVTITKSRFQPHLVGNKYRIAGPDERTAQTCQRMYVDIIGGGA